MNRFWSLLFWCVPVLGAVSYACAVFDIWPLQAAWLPENFSVSGQIIDDLFNTIHGVAAVIFLITTSVLAFCLWRYRSTVRARASHVHSNTKLEIVWSIIPAGILIFLSLSQYDSWADNKMRRPQISVGGEQVDQPPTAKIIAKQFGWEVYYPGADGEFGTIDDVYVENELYVPADESVVLQLESRDVIHSFFVPVLRLKQDIVPGMRHFCWFRAVGADPTVNYEILCTELCGWGHYKMKGWIHIIPRLEFDEKMRSLNQVRAGMAPLASEPRELSDQAKADQDRP